MSPPPPETGLPIRALAEVLDNHCEGGANHRLVVAVEGWPGAEPGQFAMLSAGARTNVDRTDPLLPRPMAIYRGHAPVRKGATAVEFLYKATGRGTRLLAETQPGQQIRLVGPLGTPFPAISSGCRAILVGGGTGIASLYELAAQSAVRAEVVVVLGARSVGDLMGVSDFEKLRVDLRVSTEDGSSGLAGRVTDVLDPLLAEESPAPGVSVYACGPTPMMKACADMARGVGVPCMVSLENNMACGFGVCLGCAVPLVDGGYSLICKAGPVYDATEVSWAGLP